MDKIDFTTASVINPSLHQGIKGEKKTNAKDNIRQKGKTIFSKFMEGAASQTAELGPLSQLAPSEETLTELMDAVHSTGSDLADRPFPDEILRYKKAVRDFMHYVVENAYSIEKHQFTRRGNIRIHVQVQVIDQKLEEIAAAILSGQTNQLERVSKLDEIKGLLVDLTISGVI